MNLRCNRMIASNMWFATNDRSNIERVFRAVFIPAISCGDFTCAVFGHSFSSFSWRMPQNKVNSIAWLYRRAQPKDSILYITLHYIPSTDWALYCWCRLGNKDIELENITYSFAIQNLFTEVCPQNWPEHFDHDILTIPFCPRHIVHDLLSVTFCPRHFVCDILSTTFCPLLFCPRHFVRDIFVRDILSNDILST